MSYDENLEKAMFSYTTTKNDLEDENKILKQALSQMKDEVSRYRTPALMVAEVTDIVNEKAIIRMPNGNRFFVNISNAVSDLLIGDQVLAEQKNLTIVDKVSCSRNFDVEKFVIIEKPELSWNDVGGLNEQEEELREVIELPLKEPKLFKKVGITPPKGVLLHGPPGTGKTLLAKAVANSTDSTFIEIVGSELVQKFIGEGAKLVKEIFDLARSKAPSIVFIDEIDALASKRIDMGTSGEREVQRTFMQLLAELDGFKSLGDVKVIGCTNRIDILDHAILRPGRLDRLVEVPTPNKEGMEEIFKIHTKEMSLEKIDPSNLVSRMPEFSGAQIKAVCTEAGYFAIRRKKTKVSEQDFLAAIEKVREKEESEDFSHMFG